MQLNLNPTRPFPCANPTCDKEVEVEGQLALPGEVWPTADDVFRDGFWFSSGPHFCSMRCAQELADHLERSRFGLSPDQRR